jgi:hypothetical protein
MFGGIESFALRFKSGFVPQPLAASLFIISGREKGKGGWLPSYGLK